MDTVGLLELLQSENEELGVVLVRKRTGGRETKRGQDELEWGFEIEETRT